MELQQLLRPPQPRQPFVPSQARVSRCRLDPRIEPVRRAARGRARLAVRVRLALRAGAMEQALASTAAVSPFAALERPYAMLA